MNHQLGMKILEERDAELRRIGAAGRERQQGEGDAETCQGLQREFALGGQAKIPALRHLAVIIDETDRAECQHREQCQPHRRFQDPPQQSGNHRGTHNQHAAHRRRSGLRLMAFRAFFANELANLHLAQPADHPGAEDQFDRQSGKTGQGRANRNVAKHVERVKIALQHVVEEIEEHLSRAPWKSSAKRRPPAPDSIEGNVYRAPRRCAPSSLRASLSPAEDLRA